MTSSRPSRAARALRRALDATPGLFTALGVALYALAVEVGRLGAPRGAAVGLVDPSAGVAVLWCAAYLRRSGWRRDPGWWTAVAVVLIVGPLMLLGHGVEPIVALLHGPAVLAQALVTSLIWGARLQPQRKAGPLAAIGRLLLACVAGAVVTLGVSAYPLIAAGATTSEAPLLGLAGWAGAGTWVVRGAAATFVVVLLGTTLMRRPERTLAPAPRGVAAALLAATVAAYGLDFGSTPRLYLLVPLTVWAASALSVRGVAWHSLALIALSTWASPLAVAGIAGSFAERALTANSFAIVIAGLGMALVRGREERESLLAQVTERSADVADTAELLATMIAATGDAVLTLDGRNDVVLANDAARDLAQGLGLPVDGLIDGRTRGDSLASVLAGAAQVCDLDIPGLGDRPGHILEMRAYPMRQHGRPGAVVFLRDVSDERRRAEGLRSFARTVAHDLRNPLTGIQISSELAVSALGEGDTDEAAAMMAAIAASGDRATRLLRDIADYSLAGDGELAAEPLYLDDFVRGVALQRAADTGAAALDLRIDADVCVQADPRLLARVFDNLLGNAAKYSEPGLAPQVDVVAYDRGDDRATVLIKDRGIGIPAGQEGLIFEAFHRVPEHAGRFPGSGLGLAICRQVVERHGGTITVEPRRGGGTVFRLSLPLAVEVPLRVALDEGWGHAEAASPGPARPAPAEGARPAPAEGAPVRQPTTPFAPVARGAARDQGIRAAGGAPAAQGVALCRAGARRGLAAEPASARGCSAVTVPADAAEDPLMAGAGRRAERVA